MAKFWSIASIIQARSAQGCAAVVVAALVGCQSPDQVSDREVAAAIDRKQREVMFLSRPAPLGNADVAAAQPGREAFNKSPDPRTSEVPADFAASSQPADAQAAGSAPSTDAGSYEISTSQPAPARGETFTITDAFAYALLHRREYQTAKEDLYLAALALTLERHLWTPQLAADFRTVYGNYGEIRDFDQAMRFVSDLSAAQRLPYGGELTARMINTLIRDVRQSITASEVGQIELGLKIPLLRNAGTIAQEQLIQLERTLTYAVRDFERFRRAQLVEVASAYFDLLRSKQNVLDEIESYQRTQRDFERAKALEDLGKSTVLETRRAEQELLAAANRVEDLREAFRTQSDAFKLLIGMPVDEPLGLVDLEDIETIERQVAEGRFPLLIPPIAADDEARALEVAGDGRLDLLNRTDQIDDAKRGVKNAWNQLLPDLDWTSTLTYDTDPAHFRAAGFESARATWRSEIFLSLPIDRFKERTEYRAALIDVQRARRSRDELLDRIRAEVRRALNRLRLENRSVEIQLRSVEVADLRREYAGLQFNEGEIDYREKQEAENSWSAARSRLSLAKTTRWRALLDLRLATETLRVADDGSQSDQPPSTPDASSAAE